LQIGQVQVLPQGQLSHFKRIGLSFCRGEPGFCE